jgi:hypothetical protein
MRTRVASALLVLLLGSSACSKHGPARDEDAQLTMRLVADRADPAEATTSAPPPARAADPVQDAPASRMVHRAPAARRDRGRDRPNAYK